MIATIVVLSLWALFAPMLFLAIGHRVGRRWGIYESLSVIGLAGGELPVPMCLQIYRRVEKLLAREPPWRRPKPEQPHRVKV